MQYDDREDPYTYPGTNTLRNRFGIKNAARLAKVEAVFTNQRMSEPLPDIALTSAGYKALHKHLFQDVYAWAGTLRTVEIAKGNSFFAPTQFLARELDGCFDAIRKDVRRSSREGSSPKAKTPFPNLQPKGGFVSPLATFKRANTARPAQPCPPPESTAHVLGYACNEVRQEIEPRE